MTIIDPRTTGAPPGPRGENAAAPMPLRLRPSVMVLDDEAMIALDLAETVEDAGYRVAGVLGRAEDALALIALIRPDLALIDHVLHGAPCDDVAAALEAVGVPFLVYSARRQAHAAAGAFRRAPWLAKPSAAARIVEELAALGATGDAAAAALPPPSVTAASTARGRADPGDGWHAGGVPMAPID